MAASAPELQREALGALRDGRFGDAERHYRALLAAHPHPAFLANLGLALVAQYRDAEAVPLFERAIAARPAELNPRVALSNALLHCGRPQEALAACDAALALQPGHRDARHNRAVALRALARNAEAADELAALLAEDPADADAEFNLALAELMLGRYETAWRRYEARWRGQPPQPPLPVSPVPVCSPGQSLANRAVLVQSEQGLGDTLQFLRFVDAARAACARLDLQVEESLLGLVRRRWPMLNVQRLGDAPLAGIELRVPLLSLPLALGIGDPGPAEPYLTPAAEHVERWRHRLPAGERRVGVAWRGNPAKRHDPMRSMRLADLEDWIAAARERGVQVVALQRDVDEPERERLAREPRVVVPGLELRDFDDTAAVMALCEQVVSVDTSVAHLAGALGRPTVVALQFASDWRWGIDRADGSTYTSVRTRRQPVPGDWHSVVRQLIESLP
jgi:hypothetical protein